MKLKHLELTNFRKHDRFEIDFDDGLVTIRGRSEAGKSTLLQALAYALFSSRALPQPLEHVVTYGMPVSSLRVSLEFSVDGVDYTVVRHKAGAELTYDGGVVTGQNEVTDFISDLIGAPANLAGSLFFANQNAIRGALSGGSKATTSMIEELADFAQIDRLIELVQSGLTTGATKPFEERLAQAEETLAGMSEPVGPTSPEEDINRLKAQRDETLQELRTERSRAVDQMEKVLKPLREQQAKWETLRTQLRYEEDQLMVAETQLAKTKLPSYDSEGHERAKRALAEAQRDAKVREEWKKAHRAFTGLPIVKSCWEGDGPSFIAFIERNEGQLQTVRSEIAAAQAELSALNRQVLEGVCQVCGLDYDSMPSVGERNAEVRRQRESLQGAIEVFEERRKQLESERSAIKVINGQWQLYRDFLAKYEAYVKADLGQVPPKVEWVVPEEHRIDLQAATEQVQEFERQQRERLRIEGEIAALRRQVAAGRERVEQKRAETELAREGLDAIGPAQGEYTAMLETVSDLEDKADKLEAEIRSIWSSYEYAMAVYIERKRTWTMMTEQAAAARKQLAEVTFNNVLLKKIRSARPAIVDRIWSTLLAAVSHYFSQMRGAPSAVSREGGTFLVDGKPIEGLSGSTLDILGLAIRVALLKTFLPTCSFLVLDEPAAACDDTREAALIGTVAAAQFEQVLLVTHSELADAYAAQLVTL